MSAAPVLTNLRKITLQIASGPTAGEIYHLAKAVVKIGRGPDNDIILDKDSKISRNHIELHQVNGLVQIHNVTEKNAMLVNGKILKSALLDGNTAVVIGDTQLNFIFSSMNAEAKKANLVPAGSVSQNLPAQRQYQAHPPARPIGYPQALAGMPSMPGMQQHTIYNHTQYQQSAASAQAASSLQFSPKMLIYMVVALVFIASGYVYLQPNKSAKKAVGIKSLQEYDGEVQTSTKATEERNKELERRGERTIQYEMAQQQYVKGMRDYHHQQYGRAILSLRTALSYYPQHEQANRYLNLAIKKQDEIVQMHMESGAKYKAEGNYRLCVASYSKVLRTLEEPSDKNYRAAEQFMQECEAEKRERY